MNEILKEKLIINKKYINNTEYYEIYFAGNWIHIKKEDIELNLETEEITEDIILEYIKKYYL